MFELLFDLGTVANPWMLEAACRDSDPDLFFPNREEHGEAEADRRLRVALAICGPCPVKQECYDYAMRTKTYYGVFGGTEGRDRKKHADRLKKETKNGN